MIAGLVLAGLVAIWLLVDLWVWRKVERRIDGAHAPFDRNREPIK